MSVAMLAAAASVMSDLFITSSRNIGFVVAFIYVCVNKHIVNAAVQDVVKSGARGKGSGQR
jgi:hypothetical protein